MSPMKKLHGLNMERKTLHGMVLVGAHTWAQDLQDYSYIPSNLDIAGLECDLWACFDMSSPIRILMPIGPWVPYMKFRDFGHTTTIPICNWIFWNFFGGWETQRAFQQAITQDFDLYCRSYDDQRNSFHLRAQRATQKTWTSNNFLENKRKLCHVR